MEGGSDGGVKVSEGMEGDGRSSRKVYECGNVGVMDLKGKVFSLKVTCLEIIIFHV